MFRDLEREQGSFTGIAAQRLFRVNLAQEGQTTSGQGLLVSGSYFSVLGVRSVIGRVFGPSDDVRVGEHSVAVLSHRYWESQLGADPSILNRTIIVNGQPLTVVGVAQRGFDGTTLGAKADIFVPLTTSIPCGSDAGAPLRVGRRLHDQDRRPHRLSRLERPMRLRDVAERIPSPDVRLDRTRAYHVEERLDAFTGLFGCRVVIGQSRSCQKEGPVFREEERGYGLYGPGRVSERDEHPTP